MTSIPAATPLRPGAGLPIGGLRDDGANAEAARDRSALVPANHGRPASVDAASAAQAAAADAAPPKGVDPALWSLLTTDEREHFARARSLGPLTYGRAPATEASTAPMRGLRLDTRV